MNKTFLLAAAFAASHAFAQSASAPIGEEAAKSLPIADAHFHVMSFMSPQTLVEKMEKHGIKWAGGAGLQGGTPERVAEVAAALGKRSIDATGLRQWILGAKAAGALENADHPAFKAAMDSMEKDLQAGARVIGEIHVNTLQSAPMELLRHKIPADAPTLKALFNLAAKYRRPLNIHAQWDSDTAAEVGRLAASNREGKLILSHCGSISSAAQIRAYMEANPNAYCDLSFRAPPQTVGRGADRAIYNSSSLNPDWRQLIEDFPDRFIVGTDDVHTWPDYEAAASNIRTGLLANLTRATAEKVAYKNAALLLGLE